MRVKNLSVLLAIILALSLSIDARGQNRRKSGRSFKAKTAEKTKTKSRRYANQEVSYRRSRNARAINSPKRIKVNNVFMQGGNDSWNTRANNAAKGPRKTSRKQ